MLGLTGKKAAKSEPSPDSVTKFVDYFDKEVHGINVRIIDTPGLEAKDLTSKEEQEALATLSILSDGKADIMLYCMKLTDRADDIDERIVQKLTRAFGEKIWRHTVLVLTFGDAVLDQNEECNKSTLEKFTSKFEEILKKAGINDIPVKSILSTKDAGHESVQQDEIIGIPVGRCTESPQDWTHLLFNEIIKKCKIDDIPAMLVLQGIQLHHVAEVLRTGLFLTLSGFGGVAGAAGAAGVGGAVGGAVGGTVLGGVGSLSGAAVGAVIGEGIGLMTGFVTGSIAGGVAACGATYAAKRLGDNLTGFAMIIRARQRVEQLKKNKAEEEKADEK